MAQSPAFEASLVELGHELRAEGHGMVAATLLEIVPEATRVDDERLVLVAERLARIAASERVPEELRARAERLGIMTSDPVARRGHSGTVWIAWEDFSRSTGWPDEDDPWVPGYDVSWQPDDPTSGWCETGPAFEDLHEALRWARLRTDAVVVRPSWDPSTHYWAGSGRGRHGHPPLDESRG